MEFFVILIILLIAGTSAYLAYKKVSSINNVLEPENLIVLLIKVPKSSDKEGVHTAPISAERLFSNLHGLLNTTSNKAQEVINFEILSSKSGVHFYVTIPENIRSFVESQIYANYPGAQIDIVDDYTDSIIDTEETKDLSCSLINIKLSKKQFFPIKTFKDFEVDPLSSLTEAMSEVKDKDKVLLQFSFKPVEDSWQDEGYKYIEALKTGSGIDTSFISVLGGALSKGLQNLIFGFKEVEPSSPKLSTLDEKHLTAIEEKLVKMGFLTEIKVLIAAPSNKIDSYKRSIVGSFRQYSGSHLNTFIAGNINLSNNEAIAAIKKRNIEDSESFVLNTEEIASIFHFPSSVVSTPNISWSLSKKGEPPLNLPIEGDVNFFGITTFRDKQVQFGIKNNEDRLRHMYFVGKTGSGKSTLFENMIVQDIKDGRGCGYIDPHGETIEKILKRIPKNRIDDVVLIDPSNSENPVGINVMECPDPRQKNLLASSVLQAIKLQFGNFSWGPRLEYLLNYAILTLIEIEGTSLLGITRLLSDKNYRKYILEKIQDPMVLKFWKEEYSELDKTFGAEAVSPIQNKVGRLLASSTIRNILGQRNSTIKFDEIMDNKKILLVNLSKGKIGDDNANLLGSLIVNRLMFYAMQRASIHESQRIPFYLYVDEFQNFATESFVTILSEARKYGLSLHLTHQYTAQLPETIKDAILGNVGSIIALTLGAQDAEILAPEFAPTFTDNDLISQEKYNFYCKLYVDGATSQPFSGRGLPPVYNDGEDFSDEIKSISSEKYGRDVKYVENKIKVWLNRPFDVGMAIAERYRAISK